MRNYIKRVGAALSAGLLLATVSTTQAASIGANFLGRNAATTLTPAQVTGVVPQPNWNNIDSGGGPFNGTALGLSDNTGTFTDVKLIFTASDAWSSDGTTLTTPDEILMKGIIKCNPSDDAAAVITDGTDRMIFTLTNVPAGTFDVLVYLTANGADAEVSVNAGGATTYYAMEENIFSDFFTRITATTPGSFPANGNYVQFDAVASVNGAITVTVIKNIVQPQVNDGAGVAAIQLVPVSAGPFPPNTLPTSITTPPASVNVLAGNPANFNVAATSPFKVQWQKNGADIPGATGTSYTTPATVLGDNGSMYRAVVYNNVNTNISAAATLGVGSPTLTQGFMTVQQWNNVTVDLDTFVMTDPGTPSLVYYVEGANQPQSAPDTDNFASAMSGWISPAVTGDYTFFLGSDDAGKLYVNDTAAVSGTNALPYPWSAAATPPILENFSNLGIDETRASNPIHLEAGKLYGMVAMLKEQTGGDFIKVAWRISTDTTPAATLPAIPPGNTWTIATSLGQTADITLQPAPTTVQETRSATFKTAIATAPTAGVAAIQWLKNGTPIPGANGTTYTVKNATLAQNGEQYSARFYTLLGITNSTAATLTVIADTFAPIPSAGAITEYNGPIQVGITFDEDVNPAGLVAGNFTLNGGTATFSVVQNSLNSYSGVVLTTTGLTPGGSYTVTVQNVADLKGNAITSTNVPFTVGKFGWANTGLPIRPGAVVPVGDNGFDVLNGGRGEWNTYDEITMAYVKKTNDFDVQVQVIYAEPSSEWARVGLQARNAMNAGEPSSDGLGAGTNASAYAQTHVNPTETLASSGVWPASDPVQPGNPTPNNGHEQNTRLDTGSATTGWGTAGGGAAAYPNAWLRLRRVGPVITGFRSDDGLNWINQGDVTLTAQQPDMYVGVEYCGETGNIWTSGFNVWTDPYDPTYDRLFVGQFRNFSDVISAQPPGSLTIAQSGGNITLTWTAGILQSAGTVNGTYTDVAGAASPYTIPTTGTQSFFRLRGAP